VVATACLRFRRLRFHAFTQTQAPERSFKSRRFTHVLAAVATKVQTSYLASLQNSRLTNPPAFASVRAYGTRIVPESSTESRLAQGLDVKKRALEAGGTLQQV
jgi:hypothetical protein